MRKVYIAGPYTKGDVAINVRKAITAGEVLAQEGFIPFIPHLSIFWHMIHPHDVEYWYQYDIHWLECCDCLLRLDGDSKGADEEMRRMAALGKPVFWDIKSLMAWSKNAAS